MSSDVEAFQAIQASVQDVAQNALAQNPLSTAHDAMAQNALASVADLPQRVSLDDTSFGFSPRRGNTHKRHEEPARNPDGKYVCRHTEPEKECSELVFDRKCEWSKHMDKHERPYKCKENGCEKVQGFTYSGGLSRHQREVHKMHGGTKKVYYCPEPSCKRNAGIGFTRKENRSEHIRRVHRQANGLSQNSANSLKRAFEDSIDNTDPNLDDVSLGAEHIITDENIDPDVLGVSDSRSSHLAISSNGMNSPTKRQRLSSLPLQTTSSSGMDALAQIAELRSTVQKLADSNKYLLQQIDNLKNDAHGLNSRLNKVEGDIGRQLID